jgi:membrane carboxypeptidase/penicillin-binding protein
MYANEIYLGHGNYGVEAACRYYFGKSVSAVARQAALSPASCSVRRISRCFATLRSPGRGVDRAAA